MKVVTFGRNDNNDVIIQDSYVGRNHCQVVENEGEYSVIDLNSTNGTFVNGTRITGQYRLSPSDEIRIGRTILNWKAYFPEESSDPIPSEISGTTIHSTSKTRQLIIVAGIVLLLVIGGLVTYFMLQPYTKHASALPRNMVALMSINLHSLQKQTELSKNDLALLTTKIEKYAFNKRIEIDQSGIKYSAPVYVFIEDVDFRRNGGYTIGLVVPISNQQQFSNFLLTIIDDSRVILNQSNGIQYVSLDNVFIGFDKKKCLCYVSSYGNNYQLEERGLELLKQDVSHSGKQSKLFNYLTDNPLSCIVSGEETERVLNTIGDFRNLWSRLGINNFSESYMALQLIGQNNGLELVFNSLNNKGISQNNTIIRPIKGNKLVDFSADDMAFAAINVNGGNLLNELLNSFTADMREEVNRFFDKYYYGMSVDFESLIRAINGDVYLSVRSLPLGHTYTYSNRKPELACLAEIPSEYDLNNGIRSIQNLMLNEYDFGEMFEFVNKDQDFLCLQTGHMYGSHTSQQQYQKDICGKFIYVSLNVNQLLNEYEGDSDLKEMMPYINSVKRVSLSATDVEMSLKLELTRTWQYMLNNF